MSNDAFFHCDVPDLEIHLCRNCFSGDKENLSDKYDQDEGCFIGHEAKLPGLAQGYYLASIGSLGFCFNRKLNPLSQLVLSKFFYWCLQQPKKLE